MDVLYFDILGGIYSLKSGILCGKLKTFFGSYFAFTSLIGQSATEVCIWPILMEGQVY